MVISFIERCKKSYNKGAPVLKSLVISSFKGQYRYSYLGVLWQIITPVIMIVLFYIVFTSFRATENSDYWLLLCTGIFPYIFMETAIIGGSMCIVNNASLIKKMNMPRQYIIYAHIVTSLITFLITFTIIVVL